MPRRTLTLTGVIFAAALAACQPFGLSAPTASPAPLPSDTRQPSPTASLTLEPTLTSTPTETPTSTATIEPSLTPTSTVTALPAGLSLDPAEWQQWPVMPTVTEFTRLVYQIGQLLGNDAHAFSVFGDCQSEAKVFLGSYETDPEAVRALPLELQETVAWFSGSFNRPSPTVRGGTTTGALLWAPWHQNKFTCTMYETPLQCELRIHKPAFVIIHVGTHYENRNEDYMRAILDQLIAAGVVPILASKADDRELDERVNSQYARLAVEYNLPFWNFWAAVEGLPNRGLYTRPDAVYQGDLYLTAEAAAIQRLSALQVLDVVRRAVRGP